MGKNLFKRGYKESRKEVERQNEMREKRKGQLWRLFLKDGEEVRVRFLTEEPITFHEHTLKRGNNYSSEVCTGDNCPFCDSGDSPQFKGAFLVWDYRKYKNKENKTVKGTLRLYVAGTKIITQLDRLHTKYGLTNRDITISRSGTGTATSYMFDRGDEDKLSKKEIEAMLPENLKEFYDGTAESLYSIVENAIMASVDDSPAKSSRYDDDEDDYSSDYSDDYDDEYDDEDEDDNTYVDDDDEDEDEEPPRRKSVSAKKTSVTKKSSAKSLFKNRKR